ncbi:hypothetical protein [Pseudomonas sp. 2FE]|uniref:hypothetical protein n=1 Tax=Pseudomonas sp. 2FE TaxID=2502190 RepID=UPI0010F6970D|nr:hypothetical protein [Pseudomonas sp. 2FE]
MASKCRVSFWASFARRFLTEKPDNLKTIIGERNALFQNLRSAKTWNAVYETLSDDGYYIVPAEGELIAVNVDTGVMFSLWDCGHNLQVFEERLGPWPGACSAA